MCGAVTADDIVQETFLSMLKADGFNASKGTVAAYLFGIARHHVIKRLEKESTTLVASSEIGHLDIAARHDTPFEAMARDQMVAAVRAAVQSLPPLYREVVVLCDLEEMDYSMVADVIQCPIGTVRSRLHRARALLSAALAPQVSHVECERRHG